MSMSNSIQGSQNLAGAAGLPAVMPKRDSWTQKLADAARRLRELLRAKNEPKDSDSDEVYFGM